MNKLKIPSVSGKKMTGAERKAGISAMSKALGHKIGTTKSKPATIAKKAKKL